jgi:hypothetical protein
MQLMRADEVDSKVAKLQDKRATSPQKTPADFCPEEKWADRRVRWSRSGLAAPTQGHTLPTPVPRRRRPVATIAAGLSIDGQHPLAGRANKMLRRAGSCLAADAASKELHGCGGPAIAPAHLLDASTAQCN